MRPYPLIRISSYGRRRKNWATFFLVRSGGPQPRPHLVAPQDLRAVLGPADLWAVVAPAGALGGDAMLASVECGACP
jgi:hypothetical protein